MMARFERTHWRDRAITLAQQGYTLKAISLIVHRELSVVSKAIPKECWTNKRLPEEPKRFKDMNPMPRGGKSDRVNIVVTMSAEDFALFKERAKGHDVSIAYLIKMSALAMLDDHFPADKLPVSLSETYPYVERD